MSLSDLLSRSRADNNININHNSHARDDDLRTSSKSAASSSSGSRFTSGKMGSEQHSQDQVWGMPDFYDSVGPEVGLGVKTVSLTQVSLRRGSGLMHAPFLIEIHLSPAHATGQAVDGTLP